MSLPDDNKFKKVHDSKLIGSQLLGVKERREPCFIWKLVGDKKVLAPVRFEIVKRAQEEFIIQPAEAQHELFGQVSGGSDTLNFFLPHSSFLFQARVKQQLPDGSLLLAFPSFVAHVERRKWMRLPAENDQRLRLQFCKVSSGRPAKHFFSKGLFDLGAGGLALLVSRAESKLFYPGEQVKNLELLVADHKIVVTAEVLRVSEVTLPNELGVSYKAWKVSLRFATIAKADQDELARFVFENLRSDEKAV